CLPFSLRLLTYYYFFQWSRHPRTLHSFPTRRSSDLITPRVLAVYNPFSDSGPQTVAGLISLILLDQEFLVLGGKSEKLLIEQDRSEEHTSELQSRENLVCRLLLEKKNKTRRCPWRG